MAKEGSPAASPPVPERPVAAFATANATLIAWLVFLGFGSAFLAFYYSQIHYFPELEWEDAFSYLAAISIFGGGIVAVYGLLLFVPGWIWSEFLIFDDQLVDKHILVYPRRKKKELVEPCFWSISRHLLFPFAVLMILLHLALFTGDDGLLVATIIFGVLGVALFSLRQFHSELEEPDAPIDPGLRLHSLLGKYVTTTAIAALSGATALYILSRLVDPQRESATLLTICTIGVVVTNLLVSVQFRNRPTRAVVTCILAALALLTCGEALAPRGQSQSERMMASFGVGESSRVSLNLTADGAALLSQSGLDPANVALLSRLGEEYVVGGTEETNRSQRAALRKEMVKSWASLHAEPTPRRSASLSSLQGWKLLAWVGDAALIVLLVLSVTLWDRKQLVRALAAVRHADRRSRGASDGRCLPLAAQKENRPPAIVVVEIVND